MSITTSARFALRHPLTRRAPLRVASNIARWQIQSRRTSGEITIPWIGNSQLVASRGMTGLTGNIYFGLHEFEEMGFLLHLLRPDDSFADVGANAGSYTVLASAAVGARTIAFEPHPVSATALRRNVAANEIDDRVNVVEAAATGSAGPVRLTAQAAATSRIVDDSHDHESLEVKGTTLDIELAGSNPTAIKIDVEGHELEALRGAQESLQRESLLALQLETTEPETIRMISELGFGLHRYDPITRTLKKAESADYRHNAIYIRDLAAVDRRVRSSPRFNVLGQEI